MWDIIRDGFSILSEQSIAILFFFITISGLGTFHLRSLSARQTDNIPLFFASMGIGSIDLCLAAYAVMLLARLEPTLLQVIGMAISILSAGLLIPQFIREKGSPNSWPLLLAALVGVVFLLLLRLAFIKYLIVPPYSDSPIHYEIIRGLLSPGLIPASKLSLETLFSSYYHFGFHAITAWLTSVTAIDPLKGIPLLGQLFLVIAPFSVAALAYSLTGNLHSAIFSCLLTAFGWGMPAFAANWGKYPALAALALLPAALIVPFLKLERKPKTIFAVAVILSGITLLHTRILICLVMAAAAYLIAGRLQYKPREGIVQTALISLSFALSLWPMSDLILDFYKNPAAWVMLAFLLPAAFHKKPQFSIAVILFLLGMDLIKIIPQATGLDLVLLDRQFLGMMLYIPLSLVGGFGFGATLEILPRVRVLQLAFSLMLGFGLLVNFQKNTSLVPDTCCNYFTKDDQLAFEWIKENITDSDLFVYSTFLDGGKIFGTDAGAWISPLTKTATNKLMFNTQWNEPSLFEEFCSSPTGAKYIYAGGAVYGFHKAQLNAQDWLRVVFESGNTSIYQSTRCH